MIDITSKISVGFALTLIGGGSAWMTSIAMQQSANAKTLETIDVKQSEYTRSMQGIERDVAIIKTKLEIISSKLERKSHGR